MDPIIDLLINNRTHITLDKPVLSGTGIVFNAESEDANARIYRRGGRIKLCDYPVEAVIWTPGVISTYTRELNSDILSFDFSGCVMAAYNLDGASKAAHIQMGENDCKEAWINYMAAHPQIEDLVMFRPDAREWDLRGYRQSRLLYLWGLITANKNCYSICVAPTSMSEGQKFTLVFIEQHTVGYTRDYYAPLLTSAGSDESNKIVWNNFWDARPGNMLYQEPDTPGNPGVNKCLMF